jgi:hypothetical protein
MISTLRPSEDKSGDTREWGAPLSANVRYGSGSSAACKRNAQPLGTPNTLVPYHERQGFGLIYGPPRVAPGSIDIEDIPPSEVGSVVS